MGQIVSSAAKSKRCNLNKLSQVPTPAAGEHILVSSDNSMNAAGQGYFDSYIVGVGNVAAAELPLHKFKAEELEDLLYGGFVDEIDYTKEVTTSGSASEMPNIRDLSAYQVGETYEVTIVAKEDVSYLMMQTRDSSSQTVQNIAPLGTPLVNGNTYTWQWTKRENEVRLVAMTGQGKSFLCTFTISHKVRQDALIDEIAKNTSDITGLNEDVSEIDSEINGEISEETGSSLFIYNAYIRTDGTNNSGTGWRRSDFIDIDKFVSCKVWLHPSVASIAFYSSKDLSTFLGYAGSGSHGTEGTFNKADVTIPSGSKYVIISTENSGTTRPYTASSITTKEITSNGLKQRVDILEDRQDAGKNKGFAHISFDDVVYCLHDITQNENTYTSIFDNDFFALLKTLHDTYGAVFSLFVFLEDATTGEHATGWTLANTTTKFATEFSANAEWLKFGLHSLNKNYNYASRSAEATTADYNSFVSSIMSITGTAECIDRLPRLGNFAGGLTQMQALRDCDYGIVGALATYDSSRDSYYLSSKESQIVYKKGVLVDAENQLSFYTSLNALEGNDPYTIFNGIKSPSTAGRFFNLEWMMHEYAICGQDYGYSSYDKNLMAVRLENACKIVAENNYQWKYPYSSALIAGIDSAGERASANDVEYIQQQIQEAEFVGASASTNAFHFIAGKTYRIDYWDVATAGVNLSARITANDTATAVSIANGLKGTGSVTFTPSQDFYFLRASAKASLRVYVDGSIIGDIVTKDDISAIENELDGKVNVKLGKNLFNKDSNLLKDGYIFNSAGDLVGGSTGYYWLISNPIDVSEHQGGYIICNKSYTISSRYNLFVAADGTKTTISCSTSAIQIPANAVTAYIAVYKTGGSVNLDEVQIEFGTAVSNYEPYNPIAGYLGDEMSSQFTFPPCPQESLHDTYATELTAAAVWARWDALVAKHPSYITKTDLGADTSGDYHIYGYSINFSQAPVYKMLFVCNQHGGSQAGDQPMGALVSAIMAEDIDGCKHRHNDLLMWIRKNVSINVIPVANPWGVDHKSRYNSAGVDLNRNWPASSWDASTDEHKGSAAGSSLEVQHIMSFITQVSPDVIIDNHTLGGVDGSADANSGYFIMGFPKSYTDDRNAYDAFFNSASATLLPEYGFQLSTGYSSPTSHNDPDLRMWGYENGYYGGLIEMNWRDPLDGNLGFTANTIEASYMFALLVYQYYKEALG